MEKTIPVTSKTGTCPVDHTGLSRRKTTDQPTDGAPLIAQDAAGVWQVRGYDVARTLLRADPGTQQAGFRAERILQEERVMRFPILYMEGEAHHEQRRKTARYFTPRAVEGYHPLMEAYAEEIVRAFEKKGQGDLSLMAMDMAVSVAGHVIGLTDSVVRGMNKRLLGFFTIANRNPPNHAWAKRFHAYQAMGGVLSFLVLDVKPAIAKRRREPQEDLITHLISAGYTDREILTECVTYGAAGMATTREFIAAAAWHLLENEELREWFLAAEQATRYRYLEEVLRVEPVVSFLHRRATETLTVDSEGVNYTISAGDKITFNVYAINADRALISDAPDAVCPAREWGRGKAQPYVVSLGDGHHRCPGGYLAIAESDIFLRRLLQIPTLQVVQEPQLHYSETVSGYELRKFLLRT